VYQTVIRVICQKRKQHKRQAPKQGSSEIGGEALEPKQGEAEEERYLSLKRHETVPGNSDRDRRTAPRSTDKLENNSGGRAEERATKPVAAEVQI
jgi:hypothetical protein